MPMNVKDEIVASESYSLEFKRVPNGEREKYLKTVVAFRHDRYELPPDGLRELVINAFAHRNYFDHDAPVFVAVYDTRVEITSPGGLPRGQTAEKAISGCSKIRNKAIAEALSYMRYVEGWGGLAAVQTGLFDGEAPKLGMTVGEETR